MVEASRAQGGEALPDLVMAARFRMPVLRCAGALLTSTLVACALAPAARADTPSMVDNVNTAPYLVNGVEKGVWGTDFPSGLVISTARQGELFDIASYSPSGLSAKGYLKDKVTGIGQCVVLETQYIDVSPGDDVGVLDPTNPCQDVLTDINDPSDHAKQINNCWDGVDGKCVNGAPVLVIKDCDLTVNSKFAAAAKDASNIDWPAQRRSGPFRKVGVVTTDTVNFRYTWVNPDGRGRFYSKVKSKEFGWVWIWRRCLRVSFSESPLGGEPKTPNAQPGPNPNGGSAS